MVGNETLFRKYLSDADTRFIIPVYQRYYSWGIENCKQLYKDLVNLTQNKNDRHFHFFGSIVSLVENKGADVDKIIIDGQQRVTTVSLLILALYHLLKNGDITAQDGTLMDRLYNTYLFNCYKNYTKLCPVETDREAYESLFNDKSYLFADSKFVENYSYFKAQLKKDVIDKKFTVEKFFNDGLCRLQVISITLDRYNDDPQLIFESLNSTGLALSEGDKIRNLILMGQPVELQENLYKKYWQAIEIYAGDNNHDVSAFIRDFLSVKLQKTPGLTKIYLGFKDYLYGQYEENKDVEYILQELLAYSRRYGILLKGNSNKNTKDIARLNTCIYRLNHLETTVTRPFLLEILRLNDEGALTDADTFNVFSMVETYIFRRLMCNVPTNSLNKIFLTLHREVMGYDGTADKYVEKLKFAITSKEDSGRFPKNDEFSKSFTEREVYSNMSPKNRIYLLERLENRDMFMAKNVYDMFSNKTYSIEHIMPQTLTPTWKNDLGPDYERVHKTCLHRIANLTISAFNSQSSNLSFPDKKKAPGGFHNNSLYLSQWIDKQDKWTEKELENRSAVLLKEALKIWPMMKTSFKPSKTGTLYSLDEENEFSLHNRKLAKYTFKGSEYITKTWKSMFGNVLSLLHAENRSLLASLAVADNKKSVLARYVHTQADKNSIKIDENIYVDLVTQTDFMLCLLRRFFKLFGVEPDDLILVLEDMTGKTAKEIKEERSRTEKHVTTRYYKFAKDIIQSIQGEDGIFKAYRVRKWKLIWDDFYIRPYYISCLAISTFASVSLTFNKSEEENRELLYCLYEHKDEIEDKLGVELDWVKSENGECHVSIERDDIGLAEETDWSVIAQFQAEWSLKFKNVLIPYLETYLGW